MLIVKYRIQQRDVMGQQRWVTDSTSDIIIKQIYRLSHYSYEDRLQCAPDNLEHPERSLELLCEATEPQREVIFQIFLSCHQM